MALKLRVYQKEAIKCLKTLIAGGDFKSILTIPTGGGKTLVAEKFFVDTMLQDDYVCLWLAHSQYLIEQAVAVLNILFPNVTNDKIVAGTSVSSYNNNTKFLATTYQYASRHIDELKNFYENKKLLLITDEAHHLCAPSYKKVIDEVPAKTSGYSLLGLTATPFRTKYEETPMLADIFPDGVTKGVRDNSSIVYSIGLKELIEMGYLANPHFIRYTIKDIQNMDISKDTNLLKAMLLHKEDISNLSENDIYNTLIVNIYEKNKLDLGKTIIFAEDQKQSEILYNSLKSVGVKVGIAISQYCSEIVDKHISDFRKGDLEVLVTCKMLSEGFDVPETCSVILAKPIASEIECTQCIGRALRKKENGKNANIVFFENAFPEGLPISWIAPDSIENRIYEELENSSSGSATVHNWSDIDEYVKQILEIKGIANALVKQEVSRITGFYFYHDTDGVVKQIITYDSNDILFKDFLENIDSYSVEDLEKIVLNLSVERMQIPITMVDLLNIYSTYKNTSNLPVFYPNNSTTENILKLESYTAILEEVTMKEGRELLREKWNKELLLQHKYSEASEFVSYIVNNA